LGKPTVFFITVDRAGPWSNVRIIDPANAMWRLMVLDTDGTSTPETVDREGYLRRALGRPLEVEWLGTSVWTRRSAVAERYSKGRVFLAGDAVHQLSPTGALGMNTGIADAVDGWKLAAVMSGWAGERLLSSYDAERRPIGNRNVGMAAEFYLAHEKFGDGLATIEEDSAAAAEVRRRVGEALVRGVGRMFRTIGLQLGYRYEDSPICLPDGTPPCPDDPEDFLPSARRAARAACVAGDAVNLDLWGAAWCRVVARARAQRPAFGPRPRACVPLTSCRGARGGAVWRTSSRALTPRPGAATRCRRMPPPSSTKRRGRADRQPYAALVQRWPSA
jgi:hypothetical protein